MAIVLLFTSLLTGLRISLVSHDTFAFLSAILPQGRVHQWHFYSGVILSCVAVFYLLRVKKIRPVRQLLNTKQRYHRFINRIGYLGLTLTLLTGWLHWLALDLAWFNGNWHYLSVFTILLYLVLHGYVYWLECGVGVVKRLFPKRLIYQPVVWLSLSCSFGFALLVYALVVSPLKTKALVVQPIPLATVIDIDGQGTEASWQYAPAIIIQTHGGANFVNGQTEVEIKALANAEEVYFLFRWADPSASLLHLPLEKTLEGWQVKEHGFYQFNETKFYEDKFAVMLSPSCEHGGDGTTHLGPEPLAGKPKNFHGKGYHASLDGKTRDLWHWKALRTNDMFLADDNHIGAPLLAQSGSRRYSAGYFADSKESGAYVMNWQWYSPKGITPKRLPKDSNLSLNLALAASVAPWFDYQPYQASLDSYPVGSVLPSVLYRSNRFEGDRADVRARGEWLDGFWTLEMVRKRETRSPNDVPLVQGTCMWVSAFDASQIAHTRHDRPVQLVFSSL